jgi:hypothetical protein
MGDGRIHGGNRAPDGYQQKRGYWQGAALEIAGA